MYGVVLHWVLAWPAAQVFYFNSETGESTWEHPLDRVAKAKVRNSEKRDRPSRN